jgi:hypothetical protein
MAQPKPFFVFFLFVLAAVVGASPMFGQEVPDPDAHQEWGVWRVMNSKYPRILGRAKCDYDIKLDGKLNSWWSIQIRNSNQARTDYVFTYQGGLPDGTNVMTAPSMVTDVPFENIYEIGTEIWGGCKDHPLPKALQMKLICMAPAGHDAPCFKDANGNTYAQAKESSSQTGQNGTDGSAPVGSANKKQLGIATIPTVGYYYCQTAFSTPHGPMTQYVSAEFTGPAGEWRDFNGPVGQFLTQKNQAWNQYLVSNYGTS